MPKAKSQTEEILKYLKTHTGITSKTAFEKFGATRLSSIIFSLRKRGYEIVSDPKAVKTRYGNTTRISEYRLVKEQS